MKVMAHGGKRERSGCKSTWQSGCKSTETKLIRVPILIAEQVLEIAHRLDAGETIDFVTNSTDAIATSTTQIASVSEIKKPVQTSLSSVSSDIELCNYGWIQPKGATKEHCFMKGKSLCRKWSYRGSSLHDRPDDYSSCRDCWIKYGKIVEQNKATSPAQQRR
jgi:hypothetical protein